VSVRALSLDVSDLLYPSFHSDSRSQMNPEAWSTTVGASLWRGEFHDSCSYTTSATLYHPVPSLQPLKVVPQSGCDWTGQGCAIDLLDASIDVWKPEMYHSPGLVAGLKGGGRS